MEYFKCDRDCAMFVAMDKLSDPKESNTKASHIHETAPPHPSQEKDDSLNLGDKVLFFNENDNPVNGVVRWIGRNVDKLKNKAKIVGIETVSCA